MRPNRVKRTYLHKNSYEKTMQTPAVHEHGVRETKTKTNLWFGRRFSDINQLFFEQRCRA